jgi:hypothetical protein
MSSQNIYAGLSTEDANTLHGILSTSDYKMVRTFLSKLPRPDVEALIQEHQGKGKLPVRDVPRPAEPTLPAGAEDIRSMVGTESSYAILDPVESDKHQSKIPDPKIEITETEIRNMWNLIDQYDVTVLSADVIEAFKYQGFNPDMILKSLMKSKKVARISNDEFLNDVTTMCALAVIKGSVTDKNIKKMSDKGKAQYDILEKRYNITRGGGRGKPAEVVTVARIAAAFPGKVIQLLQTQQVPGRDFVGEFHTHKLPGVLKHQALAACIPKDFAERSKQFLLDLVTVFSVDQTKTISKTKDSTADLVERQRQFTNVSHGGLYPPENQRKMIIRMFNWNELFSQINPVATHVKGKWNDFTLVTQQQFMEDITSLT